MKTRTFLHFLLPILLFTITASQADDEKQPRWKRASYDWKAEAKEARFTQEAIDRLAQQKFFVADQTVKQVFEPYIGNDFPLFITSDSLLNAFHVLFEESVMRLERANARRLPETLQLILKNLEQAEGYYSGEPALVAKARKRAKTIIAVALLLEGVSLQTSDAEFLKTVESEAERVVAGTARDKPVWLGPPDRGFESLDYSRFKPRGFYTKDPILQRHFRTVSWLQAIPFRVANDEELLAIRLLADSFNHYMHRDRMPPRSYFTARVLLCSYQAFLGSGDDWDLATAEARLAANNLDLKDLQGSLLKQAAADGRGPQINDQVRFAPDESGKVAEPNFRIISAYRTPDGVLFHRTTQKFARPLPSGLEVAALLGSPFARTQLVSEKQAGLLKCIEEAKTLLGTEGLYSEYLNCLAALLQPPDPAAPAFFGQEPWQIKSCQTVLGGWAQLRHTWALQAKLSVLYLGMCEPPRGFVEPAPEFYSRFATLIEHTTEVLEATGALKPDLKLRAMSLRDAVKLLTEKGYATKGRRAAGIEQEDAHSDLYQALDCLRLVDKELPYSLRPKPEDYAKAIAALAKLADDLEAGKLAADSETMFLLENMEHDIAPLWSRLQMVARRLESLAHKQLRQLPFSTEEETFIGDYGKTLAGIMFYGGNSYSNPRDDAPRAVDVCSNPNLGRHLIVGIGRPRVLFILYPWQGKELLCSGAVMPYHEFAHTQRITDAEWKNLLDSTAAPPAPAWLKSIQMEKPFVPLKEKMK